MTLILNDDDVKQVLTMEITMNALDQAYRELTRREAVCRPRIDVQDSDERFDQDLSVGHDGRRLHFRLFCHPHEVGRDLRAGVSKARLPRKNICPGPAGSAA